jgi:uncharacterized phage protein gp47/JayE
MADYGITEDGFKRKTREEIVEDMKLSLKNKFSSLNMTDKNPLIKIVKVVSYPIALYWFALESIYNNRWISTATGHTLDEVVQYLGITRQPGTKAVTDVVFTGDDLTFIPEEFLVETVEKEPVQFQTVESGYIEDGSITLQVQALEDGENGNVAADTIAEVVNPISGLDSVNNPSASQGGSERETDQELRERYIQSYDRAGGSTTNSIRANILEETDTTACIVLENVTIETDSNGLPPKSFESIVYGGVDEEIAQAIFNKKPAGIESFGSISVLLDDDSGNEQTVGFSRASEVDIYIDLDISTNSDTFPSDGETQIKDEIIEYIGGELSDGSYPRGLNISEDVIYNKIIDLIFNITGVEDVNSLAIGTSASPTGTSNITVGFREVALTDSSWIVITNA